ncbi:unnamed protein product [Paramecium primaurelia]|uniref:Uncharacterized protein n=1 Tax=Paramecium primaurelia TaxID=5886 RepID=A0A8S1KC75_PARPR|nr:unnamed protein product [Paramecium primaurelia]
MQNNPIKNRQVGFIIAYTLFQDSMVIIINPQKDKQSTDLRNTVHFRDIWIGIIKQIQRMNLQINWKRELLITYDDGITSIFRNNQNYQFIIHVSFKMTAQEMSTIEKKILDEEILIQTGLQNFTINS